MKPVSDGDRLTHSFVFRGFGAENLFWPGVNVRRRPVTAALGQAGSSVSRVAKLGPDGELLEDLTIFSGVFTCCRLRRPCLHRRRGVVAKLNRMGTAFCLASVTPGVSVRRCDDSGGRAYIAGSCSGATLIGTPNVSAHRSRRQSKQRFCDARLNPGGNGVEWLTYLSGTG